MRNREIEMVSVTHILQTVVGSCDFGSVDEYGAYNESGNFDMDDARTAFWKDVISTKSKDTGFGHLVESIIEHGFTGSAIGWEDGEITEGHHRLVAAILLGLEEVPVSVWGHCGTHAHPDGRFSAHGCFKDPYPFHITFD